MNHKYHPNSKFELSVFIKAEIELQGNKADLNCIDTSLITDMSHLFEDSKFNGDISRWDVSAVTNMSYMFERSGFSGDLSKWSVKSLKDVMHMFDDAPYNSALWHWRFKSLNKDSKKYVKEWREANIHRYEREVLEKDLDLKELVASSSDNDLNIKKPKSLNYGIQIPLK